MIKQICECDWCKDRVEGDYVVKKQTGPGFNVPEWHKTGGLGSKVTQITGHIDLCPMCWAVLKTALEEAEKLRRELILQARQKCRS